MSAFSEILSIIGYLLKVILDSAVLTSSRLLFGFILLIQTIAGSFGAGQTLSLIISVVLVVAILVLLFKYLWNTARALVVVVLGIILIGIILSYIG